MVSYHLVSYILVSKYIYYNKQEYKLIRNFNESIKDDVKTRKL